MSVGFDSRQSPPGDRLSSKLFQLPLAGNSEPDVGRDLVTVDARGEIRLILDLRISGCRIDDQYEIVVALNAGVVDEALSDLAVRRVVLELKILPFDAELRRGGIVKDIAQRLRA